MEKVFAVVGLGSFGRQLCITLMEKGGKVIAVDKNPDLVEMMKEKVTSAILLDAVDEKALSGASIQEADFAIVAIGENVEASILATLILKQLSVPYVIARAISEIHHKVLKKVGADEIINLEEDEGIRLASRLAAPEMLDRIPLSADISIAEIYLPTALKGRKGSELQIDSKFDLAMVAMRRFSTEIDREGNPLKKEVLLTNWKVARLTENDVLIVMGKNRDIDRFIEEGESL